MSSGMFRSKESSNRIEISQLVQDLLNFGDLGSLWLLGWGSGCMGVGDGWGCPPHMCTCIHMHAHIHIKHDNFNCNWQPPLGESLGIPNDVICMCVCMCMHVCMCIGAPLHHPPPPSPTLGPLESVKIQ